MGEQQGLPATQPQLASLRCAARHAEPCQTAMTAGTPTGIHAVFYSIVSTSCTIMRIVMSVAYPERVSVFVSDIRMPLKPGWRFSHQPSCLHLP